MRKSGAMIEKLFVFLRFRYAGTLRVLRLALDLVDFVRFVRENALSAKSGRNVIAWMMAESSRHCALQSLLAASPVITWRLSDSITIEFQMRLSPACSV